MTVRALTDESAENFWVLAEIRQLNQYVQRARKIAISAINPFTVSRAGQEPVVALNIRVEGPPTHIGYFRRLIDAANLKIG